MERIPNGGQPFTELKGQIDLDVGGTTGQMQRRLHLRRRGLEQVSGAEIVRIIQLGDRFGHGLNVGIHPCLKMGHHSCVSLQQTHPVITGHPIPINTGQDHCQQQTRRNRLQISRQPVIAIGIRIEKIQIGRQHLGIEHTFDTTTRPRQIPYLRRPI